MITANMSHFVAYVLQFQEIIVYKIPPGGEGVYSQPKVYTVNNLCMFNCQCHFYLCNRGPYVRLAFVPNMLSY